MKVTAIVLLLIALGGAGVIRAIAARKLARDQGGEFWPLFVLGFMRARLLGVPAGVLFVVWFYLFAIMAVVAWISR